MEDEIFPFMYQINPFSHNGIFQFYISMSSIKNYSGIWTTKTKRTTISKRAFTKLNSDILYLVIYQPIFSINI